jgi:hypothetical protein
MFRSFEQQLSRGWNTRPSAAMLPEDKCIETAEVVPG